MLQQQQQHLLQQSKEDLMAYTNDLCRLTSKAHAWGLQKDDLARLHSDIDAIKHIATSSSSSSSCSTSTTTSTSTTSTTTNSALPSSEDALHSTMSLDDGMMTLSPSSSFSSSPAMPSSPVGSRSTSPTSGFLSAALAALSTNVVAGQQQMTTTTTSHAIAAHAQGDVGKEGKVGRRKRTRNRGKNFPADVKRACTICKAEKTSQWRSGADGRPTHSMKQHRQYLASTQKLQQNRAGLAEGGDDAASQQTTMTTTTTTTTAEEGRRSFTSDELFARLRELQGQFKQRQAQHLTQADSTDSMDESHHHQDDISSLPSSLCSSPSPLVVMPRRSSIYSLLN